MDDEHADPAFALPLPALTNDCIACADVRMLTSPFAAGSWEEEAAAAAAPTSEMRSVGPVTLPRHDTRPGRSICPLEISPTAALCDTRCRG